HLVVDFHEWFSENVHWSTKQSAWAPYPPEWKRALQELEVRCLNEASATITVCDSIADAMKAELGGSLAPGLWMHQGAQRVLQEAKPGVLYNDLNACNAYQNGLTAAAA
uniref:hypothetical protein n=1 Tax=Streptomyces galilaeus TaxID=33899 RepID=UPI0038F6A4F9